MTLLRNLSLFLIGAGSLGIGIILGFGLTKNLTIVGLVAATETAGCVLLIIYSSILVFHRRKK